MMVELYVTRLFLWLTDFETSSAQPAILSILKLIDQSGLPATIQSEEREATSRTSCLHLEDYSNRKSASPKRVGSEESASSARHIWSAPSRFWEGVRSVHQNLNSTDEQGRNCAAHLSLSNFADARSRACVRSRAFARARQPARHRHRGSWSDPTSGEVVSVPVRLLLSNYPLQGTTDGAIRPIHQEQKLYFLGFHSLDGSLPKTSLPKQILDS